MYSIFLLLFLTLTLIIFLIFLLKRRFTYIYAISITFFIIYLIYNPKISITGALNGMAICSTSIIPTLLPFLFCCNFLLYTNAIDIYNKFFSPIISRFFKISAHSSFAIISSYLCGYPIGAKFSSNLYTQNLINKNEYQKIISIASNASPLFLTSVVATVMLDSPSSGILLLIVSYASSIIIGIFLIKKEDSIYISNCIPSSTTQILIGEAIKKSIEDSVFTLLTLCGYIIIFSILISIIKNSSIFLLISSLIATLLNTSKELISAVLLGILEVTNGASLIKNLDISLTYKLCMISFLTSFGGLSIIAQTSSFFSKHNISFKKYFTLKLLQGFISFFIMFILCKVILI